MNKILFTTSSFDLQNFTERASVEAAGYTLVLNPYGKRLTEQQVTELLAPDVVGMVAGVEPLKKSLLLKAKSLKVISRCGIGLDNVDLVAASELGISVYNTPDAPTRSVAELTLAHILSLSRRIVECDRDIRRGRWKAMMGSLLAKQTVGIIGYGRIGQAVAALTSAFGSRVLAYDTRPIKAGNGVKLVDMKTLLSECDIVTLHVPYSAETRHIINRERLALMKKTALLINTARGGLVDEIALYTALKEDRIGGAALDSFEEEPYAGPLLNCENVQMTAHMGSYAREARDMMETEACALLVKGLRQHGLLK